MRKGEVDWYLKREAARGLSRPARAVYRVLLVCARSESGTLRFERIGDQRFRDETGYGRTSVKAARKELIEAGLLEVLETGLGRDRSVYRVILAARQQELAIAAGAEGLSAGGSGPPPGDPLRVNPRPSEGQILTHPTHARPSLSGSLGPYPPGQGPSTGEAAALRATASPPPSPDGAGAIRCPVATSRGKPCASCRACGTNPRAQRRRLALQVGPSTAELFAGAPPPEQRVEITQRGLQLARATLASTKAGRSAPGSDQGGAPGKNPTGAGGRAP